MITKTPRTAAELAKILRDAPAGEVSDEVNTVAFVMLGTEFRDELATALEIAAGIPQPEETMSVEDFVRAKLIDYLENDEGCRALFRSAPGNRYVYQWEDAESKPDLADDMPIVVVKPIVCLLLEDFRWGVDMHILQHTSSTGVITDRMHAVLNAVHDWSVTLPDGRVASFDSVKTDMRSREIGDVVAKFSLLPF